MKARTIKKIYGIYIFTISTIMMFTMQSFALSIDTHRAINVYIVDPSKGFSGYSLDKYLKNNLGISDGVTAKFDLKMVQDWVGDGGEYEDAGSRPFNHFLNPLTNQGLSGQYSALAWATLPVGGQPLSPFASWYDVRDYYEKALTAKDKATREDYFTRTFQGVGQVMHLVQDMSIPAHTRGDKHPTYPLIGGGDGYELWFLKPDVPPISSYYAVYFSSNNTSFLLPNLFDTDQYNKGTNPAITLSYNIGLAEFTNANFLSSKTIFKDFTYPDWSNLQEYEEEIAAGKTAIYQRKTGAGIKMEHFVREKIYYDKLPSSDAFRGLMLDDKVHKDYADFLVPRAIGYSSQVLSYFFRGQLEAEMGEGNLKVKNASNETMTGGKFELYCDNAAEVRNKITITAGDAVPELLPTKDQTITFTPPTDGAESYMLVYKGQLGNESGAVIGKFIPMELVVITVSLSGISGENLTKKSVLVWNPTSSSLTRAPLDNADTDFQKWYKTKTSVGENMFTDGYWAGVEDRVGLGPQWELKLDQSYGAFLPIGYKARNVSAPSPLDPSTLDTAYDGSVLYPETYWSDGLKGWVKYSWKWDYKWDVHAMTWGAGNPWGNYLDHLYPTTRYYDDQLSGNRHYFRTRREIIAAGLYDIDISDVVVENSAEYNNTCKDTFYGHLGKMGSFNGTGKEIGYGIGNVKDYYYIPHWREQVWDIGDYIPPNWPSTVVTWENNPHVWTSEDEHVYGREWFDHQLKGRFSTIIIANVCMVQFTPCTTITEDLGEETLTGNYTFGSRTIMIQAQALYVPQGTTGYDWVAKGRNAALEGKIIEAIEMAYSLNGIPANEIRKTSISIAIVK